MQKHELTIYILQAVYTIGQELILPSFYIPTSIRTYIFMNQCTLWHAKSWAQNITSTHKRFYTIGTLRSIRIPRLAKILTLYRDWLSMRSLKLDRRGGGW